MKKRWPFITVIISAIAVIAAAAFYMLFIHDSIDAAALETTDLTAVSAQRGSLTISVDPRIELLSAVQLTSDYKRLGSLSFPYRDAMKSYFDPFKSHEAVKHFTWLTSFGFSYDAPPQFMMHLTEPPSLMQTILYDSQLKRRGMGAFNLDRFAKLLGDFYQTSDFQGFYDSNRALYEQIVKAASAGMGTEDPVRDLEDYYGIAQKSYSLILAPLFHPGGYGIRTDAGDGTFNTYAVIGPYKTENQVPIYDWNEIRGLVWHEFSHSFINPLTEKYSNEIRRYSSLYLPVKDIMSSQAYTNWETCVNEHLVRAVTTRLAYLSLGKTEGDKALRYEKGNGFIYMDELCKKLEEYEKQSDTYKTLEDFYPEILKTFEELSKQAPEELQKQNKYDGPINSIFTRNNPVVLIVPTNEEDEAVEEEIVKYAGKIKDRFFKNGKILDDKTALNEDLSANTVIVYGTIQGNLWLSKYKDYLPVKMEADRIIADTAYEGSGYKFICGYKNPQNENNPILIYTAQAASDILNINSIMHGPNDYVIAKGNEIIKSSDFSRNGDTWSY